MKVIEGLTRTYNVSEGIADLGDHLVFRYFLPKAFLFAILVNKSLKSLDECFVQLGKGLFGGTPRCRGHGAECFKAEEELCAEGLDVKTKGEGSAKSNAEELGSGVECKVGAS